MLIKSVLVACGCALMNIDIQPTADVDQIKSTQVCSAVIFF